jgi:CheY-like chemotaxis protein
MDAISVLLVGDVRRDEFHEARDFLAGATRLRTAAEVAAGVALLASGEVSPEVIVVAATWPGEFSAAQVDQLRQAAPLARLLSLVGSWSEGETRTGQPWPGVPRIYAHQFVPRFGAELERLATGNAPTWSLPITATEDERLLAAYEGVRTLEGVRHLKKACLTPFQFGIAARDAETAEALAEALQSCGYSTRRISATDNGQRTTDKLVIWVGRGGDSSEVAALRRFVERQTAPVIALLDFPRAADRQRAIEAGAAAVVSKPLLLVDLFWQIDRLERETIDDRR